MNYKGGLTLAAVIGVSAIVFLPAAAADPGSPSYNLGKQSIDDAARKYGLTDANGLEHYCTIVLETLVKSGTIRQLDSRSDFIAGCVDEGRAIVASHR